MDSRPKANVGPPGTQDFVDHLFENGAFAKDIEARRQYPRRQNTEILVPDVRECEPGLVFEDAKSLVATQKSSAFAWTPSTLAANRLATVLSIFKDDLMIHE